MEATFWIQYVVKDNKDKILTETQQLRSIISGLGLVFCSFLRDYVTMMYFIWKELFSSLNLRNDHPDSKDVIRVSIKTGLSIKWSKIEL